MPAAPIDLDNKLPPAPAGTWKTGDEPPGIGSSSSRVTPGPPLTFQFRSIAGKFPRNSVILFPGFRWIPLAPPADRFALFRREPDRRVSVFLASTRSGVGVSTAVRRRFVDSEGIDLFIEMTSPAGSEFLWLHRKLDWQMSFPSGPPLPRGLRIFGSKTV